MFGDSVQFAILFRSAQFSGGQRESQSGASSYLPTPCDAPYKGWALLMNRSLILGIHHAMERSMEQAAVGLPSCCELLSVASP